MRNGCVECEKLDDGKLCNLCALGMLQCTAEAAIADYTDKVNEILKGKKDDDNHRNN